MAMKNCVFFVCLLFCQSSLAQTIVDSKTINTIKRDTTYLYGECRSTDLAEALSAAKLSLELNVKEWVDQQHASEGIEICIVKAKEHCYEIQTMTGSQYRALVYVKKSDILPVADKKEVSYIQFANKTPKQEPVAEKPLVIEKESEQEVEPAPQPQQESLQNNDVQFKNRPDTRLSSEEKKMIEIKSKDDLEFYLKGLYGMGKIKKNGKKGNIPQNEDFHLFVYDRQGGVPAVLRKEGSVLINLKEKREDSIKNYDNCGFVWIQLR